MPSLLSFTDPAALQAGLLVSLIKVSQRQKSTEPKQCLVAGEGEAERLSLPLQSLHVSEAGTDRTSQRAVSVCALCSSAHLTRQVCALRGAGPQRPRILLWFCLE